MLRKCLIANRGEIAIRIIRACRELGIRTVAVYSDVDAKALHVRIADEAYPIGAAAPSESYLNSTKLLDVARHALCDCVHPGYGFLSEVETFAEEVIASGLVWVGPPPQAIRQMGVKTEARALMSAAGVPLVPGYQSEIADDTAFQAAADQIGYPIMVKAAGGGGGKGIRVVHDPSELLDGLGAARREALHAFGDARVYLEKFIERARHVEIQILADTHGNIVHLFERECSLQRRHQKVIEESPSTLVTSEMRQEMGSAAVEAARTVGYVNAGTVEFIASSEGDFYFLEMNTRLQVEHPVTEMVTGLDLVKLQFAIAAGEALPFIQADVTQRGHAIEARVYAEDVGGGFLPSIGTILRFVPPTGIGVRVDSGVESGDSISVHYDPMIAKIVIYDSTRFGAVQRLAAALRETVILGTTTNLSFLQKLVDHPQFVSGETDTNFIERHLDELLPSVEKPIPDLAVIAAAIFDLQTKSSPISAQPAPFIETLGRVRYDPWSKADGFRIGQGATN